MWWIDTDTKISSVLSKSKFTSWSCSGDFLCSTFFSDLFAFSASQNVVLRSFSLSSRRSRVPINNFMSPFISSMLAIGRSTNPWAAGVSCCFRDLKSSSTTRSAIFKGLNRRLFLVFQVSFGLLEDPSQFFPPSFEPWAGPHHETLRHLEVLTCQNSRGEPSTVRLQAS